MSRAVAVFQCSLRGKRLTVRVLPTEADVDAVCRFVSGRSRWSDGTRTRAFFVPPVRRGSAGTIVLPAQGRLTELVAHEATHAVMYGIGGVHCSDDERLATDVGLLTARILRQLARRGIEVRP